MADYFSFEDVLSELQLDEDELKRMVSEGELRAFRDENKMKFRRDDVESLKKGRVTEPTIILPGSQAPKADGSGETILDMDNLSSGGVDETALPDLDGGGADRSKEETVSGETTGITEEMIFDDSDLTVQNEGPSGGGIETQETFIEGEGTTGMTTEPLKFDEAAEGAATVQEPAVRSKRSGLQESVQPSRQTHGPMMVPVAAIQSHPILTSVLVLCAVMLGMMGAVLMDMIRVVTDDDKARINQPSAFAGEVAKTFVGTFGFEDVKKDVENLMLTGTTTGGAKKPVEK